MSQRTGVCEWGITDVNIPVYSNSNSANIRPYRVWRGMINRCYDTKTQKRNPMYIGCVIDERWRHFSSFFEWYNQNYQDVYDLDKDILIKGNKVYGPDTCCFVPHLINSIFTKSKSARGLYPIGVCRRGNRYQARMLMYDKSINLGSFSTPSEAFQAYKTAKEAYIKEVATSYYNEGKITEKVYRALMNYQVEITD